MASAVRWKVILIAAIVVCAIILILPPSEKIKLGLDLKGGIYLLCRVVTDEAVAADLTDAETRIQRGLEEKQIVVRDIRPFVEPEKGIFELRFSGVPEDRLDEFREYLGKFTEFDLRRGANAAEWVLAESQTRQEYLRNDAVEQTLRTINNRIDKIGVVDPEIIRQGLSDDRILIQLPGVDDPERVKDLISEVGNLEFKLLERGPFETRQEALGPYGGTEDKLPSRLELLSGTETDDFGTTRTLWFILERIPVATGRDLTHASPDQDQYGMPAVQFNMGGQSAKRFAEFTGKNIGRHLAIVLESRVESYPVIRNRIPGSGQISGLDSEQEMRDLLIVLNAGAHPASIQYLHESTVGSTLGHDSIRNGIAASVIGLCLVVIFMVFYYKWSGINAVVALCLNLVLMLGAIAFLGSVLTLPGIAGFILTIGMAVDANVLVFERIREDLRAGKTVKSSIEGGFSKAFMTIFDANVTTLIAALILFIYGTGPIRGFAITLSFGILASMFTAVFVSRTIFEAFILSKKGRVDRLSI